MKIFDTDNPAADFAVKASGDSMEPDIPNGSILLIKGTNEVRHAKTGIFFHDGNTYCKKLIRTEKGALLVSINKKYPPIPVSPDSDFRVFGEVIEVVPE